MIQKIIEERNSEIQQSIKSEVIFERTLPWNHQSNQSKTRTKQKIKNEMQNLKNYNLTSIQSKP